MSSRDRDNERYNKSNGRAEQFSYGYRLSENSDTTYSSNYERDRSRRTRSPRSEHGWRRDRSRSPKYRDRRDRRSNERYRRRRSRSRSRSRSPRQYEKRRDRDSYRRYGNSPSYTDRGNTKWRNDAPSNTLIVRSLPLDVTEEYLKENLSDSIECEVDIRVPRSYDESGSNRSYGFIEFPSANEAEKWMESVNGQISINCHRCNVYFCQENLNKSRATGERSESHSGVGWDCEKCGQYNFKKRDNCYKCDATKESAGTFFFDDVDNLIGLEPSDTILLRNLDNNVNIATVKEEVFEGVSNRSVFGLVDAVIGKDRNTQNSFCVIQFRTRTNSEELYNMLMKKNPPLTINGNQVPVAYLATSLTTFVQNRFQDEKQGFDNRKATSRYQTELKDGGNYGAAAAQAAMAKRTMKQTKVDKTVTPEYIYEPSSGCYYYPSTGMYYDPRTGYYYNPVTKQYLQWNPRHKQYVTIPQATSASPAQPPPPPPSTSLAPPNPDKKSKEDAIKLAKNMEKWAESVNQKKAAAAASAVTENEANVKKSSPKPAEVEQTIPSPKLSDAEVSEEADDEMPNFINADRLICLLCKRQFNTLEILNKHCEQSQLHKDNLEKYRAEQEASKFSYRDRAAERRQELEGLPKSLQTDHTSSAEKMRKVYMQQCEAAKSKAPPSSSHVAPKRLGEQNVGHKMMKALGWQEGKGLGFKQQGIVNPLEASGTSGRAGLGSKKSLRKGENGKPVYEESYMDRVKSIMRERYESM